MRNHHFAASLKAALRVVCIIPFAAALGYGQVSLTAGPTSVTMPDGASVPMWGYTCGAAVAGNTGTCAALNPNAGGGWSPVIITVPTGSPLTINLANALSFANGNSVPTSLMIVGQLGGGLGSTATTTASPTHAPYGVTWSTVNTGATFQAPKQGNRVQSFLTEVAVGGSGTLTWANPKPGTYLLESGTHPSIQVPMGLYGILVVTAAPTGTTAGTAYPNVSYNADVALLMSEIDPVQNAAVSAAVNHAGFSETAVWSGQPGGCGNPSSATYQTCYPPAVNYTPLYYAFNGVPFDKTHAANSTFATNFGTAASPITGNVLVRFVNAGSRMHVPSIVGAQTGSGTWAISTQTGKSNVPTGGFSLVAEDGNPLPGLPRVQNEVFMAAGKTYDVMINAPGTGSTALPVYDRELSLSGGGNERDAGMLAYLSINGAALPAAGALGAATANADTYSTLVAGQTFTISDPSKGVIANDINVYGVKVSTPPANGTLSLNTNGTFTYVPNAGVTADSFGYCGNGATSGNLCTTVTLNACTSGSGCLEAAGGITVNNDSYTSTVSTFYSVRSPGILGNDYDSKGYQLSVANPTAIKATGPGTLTLNVDSHGGFTAAASAPGTYTFTYHAQNSQGTLSANSATVTVTFPTGSNLTVNVVDGYDKTTAITDYRWIIEEDKTFYVNPACVSNPPPASAGCQNPGTLGAGYGNLVPTYGVNFHTSHMDFVAQGCTGAKSCEAGQTMYDANPSSPTYGQHIAAVCDLGDGICRPDATGNGQTATLPSQVYLDPTKRYYISVLPGDAGDPFAANNTSGNCQYGASAKGASNCGHGMGGAPIFFNVNSGNPVTVLAQPSPYPPAKLSVFVFEDDFPLNGEVDSGGGVDILAPLEPGLGGFQIHLWDSMSQNGDFTGQMTYDMFNQPLTNSLAGTIDPATGQDACPISPGSTSIFSSTSGMSASGSAVGNTITVSGLTVDQSQVGNTLVISSSAGGFTPGTYTISSVDTTAKTWTLTPAIPNTNAVAIAGATGMQGTRKQPGVTGMIVTCPKYEGDGVTLSPLAGQVVVSNLMPGRWEVIATPGADRIARGEEWLQTNTLDGQHAHDTFVRIGEPTYFQEYGPANFHATIGFANPNIINNRLNSVCSGQDLFLPGQGGCSNTVTGKVTGQRLSRPPDERLYNSESRDTYWWTQCYASLGDPDGEDFAFTKCDAQGNFTFKGIPTGNWRVTTFDQWNDQLVDGLSTPVAVGGTNSTVNMGNVAATQWQTNLYTRTFIDDNKDGVSQASETGIPFQNVSVRLRDGSLENLLQTDFTGTANFNETFPLFSWYVVETDVTRYKNTGTHVVYDVGGPADGTTACSTPGYPPCGKSVIGKNLANTAEIYSLPTNLRVPGAVYCADADCSTHSGNAAGTESAIQMGSSQSDPPSSCTVTGITGVVNCSTILSSGRIDPPWVGVEGWQGFPGQNNFVEFGKEPYAANENGGIKGHVIYASTRPFDDPQMLVQVQWEPLVPHVTINLYQEGTAPDGSQSLTLVDHTQTSSFDDWAQGFHLAADGVTQIPNMNCPGQGTNDLFYFTLQNQPNYLNVYANLHGGPAIPTIPNQSQFKCYDGMHNWNQIEPAPYDGMYQFPSVTSTDPTTGKPNGTNCTICQPNTAVPSTDLYYGLPMLPVGKYVVEVVVPPGFELVKEEDKNILIGDNFIAPVSQQFGGLGNVFILPDQASVGSAYNANNAQQPTQSLGAVPENGIVPGFTPDPVWPCVGEQRIVPDYISLFPQTKQVSPFAGATRNLCDRKEVTLSNQTGAIAKFYVFTSTHIASKFTGGITDDFTAEFDPFSPQYGEKFAPNNMPVSIKDWSGAEISRVYSDQWGAYNGMTYSTWEVNPPNPTGYSPSMMVFCMNDPGNGTTPDPLFNTGYSQFCYELPQMPGTTQYLDTPVVPTAAFSGGYNQPDCAYPDATPAISEVDGDGKGPWVAAAGHTLTINALGTATVINNAYSGPAANTAPYNVKTVNRNYVFGSTQGTVTIGGVPATVTAWSNSQVTVTVPSGVPACAVQQQAQYGGSHALCGQLVVTAANGKQSVDTVTVTIGGKAPTYVTGTTPLTTTTVGAIQTALDNALPGDLIMVPPGLYNELLIMWKPVRLQGVGAASVIVNANTQPAGKLDPWRARVSCLFGLATNGQPATGYGAAGTAMSNLPSPTNNNPFDPTGTFTCGGWPAFTASTNNPQVDRLPLEGILGWDTTVNGNLAQLLQEPTLMGAYEGSALLVLSKGVNVPANVASSYYGSGAEAGFPTGTVVLTANDCATGPGKTNLYPSNFWCNPSSVDGMSFTDASQGGGGVFVHAWAHNLQIANNRIYNNIGTLSGGLNIGQGESPDAYLNGDAGNADPGSCNPGTGLPLDTQLPYCFDMYVNVHHNMITQNTSIGDEVFSGTPAGAGGASICTGADYYKFNYNWVCGNMSTGDGGGFSHLGFIWNGDIEHNTVIFNQSFNPTISTNGGGIIIMGAAPDGTTAAGVECGGTVADADCTPGLPDGTGPGLVINANLIMGNGAEAGSGGGLRLQSVNGTEIYYFPNGSEETHNPTHPNVWNTVQVTNNIIANNVAGWDGAGISLQDALAVNLINNTIVSNDTTATAGVLFNTIGAPLASAPGVPTSGQTNATGTQSLPQPAGLVAINNSPQLTSQFPTIPGGTITCPPNFYAPGTSAKNGTCLAVSYPYMANNVFWQNRSFDIGVGGLSNAYQQNIVTLYNAFTGVTAATQPPADGTTPNGNGMLITGGTGACPSSASYWDIGVRGDTGPGAPGLGISLAPFYSVLTNATENGKGTGNFLGINPTVASQYCNGARTPPEWALNCPAGQVCGTGWNAPPGISDATVPNPIFNLTPTATVDEGNNWVNLTWGPLTLTHPATGSSIDGAPLGNYALAQGSPAIDAIPRTAPTYSIAPKTDFFGNSRPDVSGSNIDVGAVEYRVAPPTISSISPAVGDEGQTVVVTITGQNLAGVTSINISGGGIGVVLGANSATSVTATFTITANAVLGARNVSVSTATGTSNALTFTVLPAAPALTSITPASGDEGATITTVTLRGTNLAGTTAVNLSNPGITVSNVTVVSNTTVTATFAISATAATGAGTVSVTTASGTSNTVTFTVNPLAPALTSIAPNTGARSSTVAVTISGTNLSLASAVNVSGNGVTATITGNTATTVTANFVISATATLSTRNVSVTTPGGTSNTVTFTVALPTLSSITPNTGVRGTTVPVTITGTLLAGATGLNFSGTGLSANSITVNPAGTSLTAKIVIATGATLGAQTVSVTTPGGATGTVPFTVQGPTLASIAPATASRGNTVTGVVLTGANLSGATALTISGGGITYTITGSTATTVTANLTIAANAGTGIHTISVTTPIGTTGTVNFTVANPPNATLASISTTAATHPASGTLAVSETLTGTNFTTTGMTVAVTGGTGGAVTVTNVTVVNATTITATFNVPSSARGAHNVTVTNPSGVASAAKTFTVN